MGCAASQAAKPASSSLAPEPIEKQTTPAVHYQTAQSLTNSTAPRRTSHSAGSSNTHKSKSRRSSTKRTGTEFVDLSAEITTHIHRVDLMEEANSRNQQKQRQTALTPPPSIHTTTTTTNAQRSGAPISPHAKSATNHTLEGQNRDSTKRGLEYQQAGRSISTHIRIVNACEKHISVRSRSSSVPEALDTTHTPLSRRKNSQLFTRTRSSSVDVQGPLRLAAAKKHPSPFKRSQSFRARPKKRQSIADLTDDE